MKPILKYPGAKWRLADWIISYMPPHIGYVEPFGGSLAVLLNKKPSRLETVNDLDGAIVRFFRACRDQPDELAEALALTPWARDEFAKASFDDFGELSDIEAARQFAVRVWQGFGARVERKNGWRHSSGKTANHGPACPKIWQKLPEIIVEAANRLKNVQIENRPAIEVIGNNDGPHVLIYADPPYMMSTRSFNGDQYRFEMCNEDHEELLKALSDFSGMVLLSGYDCDLYKDMLHGWQMVSMSTIAERAAARTECLWINPLAAERNAQISIFSIGGS